MHRFDNTILLVFVISWVALNGEQEYKENNWKCWQTFTTQLD